jgi:hypothetical protein
MDLGARLSNLASHSTIFIRLTDWLCACQLSQSVLKGDDRVCIQFDVELLRVDIQDALAGNCSLCGTKAKAFSLWVHTDDGMFSVHGLCPSCARRARSGKVAVQGATLHSVRVRPPKRKPVWCDDCQTFHLEQGRSTTVFDLYHRC